MTPPDGAAAWPRCERAPGQSPGSPWAARHLRATTGSEGSAARCAAPGCRHARPATHPPDASGADPDAAPATMTNRPPPQHVPAYCPAARARSRPPHARWLPSRRGRLPTAASALRRHVPRPVRAELARTVARAGREGVGPAHRRSARAARAARSGPARQRRGPATRGRREWPTGPRRRPRAAHSGRRKPMRPLPRPRSRTRAASSGRFRAHRAHAAPLARP